MTMHMSRTYLNKAVVLYLLVNLFTEKPLEELDKAITLVPEKGTPYFWKGILSVYHTTPSDAKDAIESIQQALVLGLPPVLLTPLYWLEHDRPKWFSQYARPLLDQYGI